MTERPAPGGPPWLEYDSATGRLLWADTLHEWHGVEAGAAPSWKLMHDRRHPDDAPEVAAAVVRCLTDGTPVCELHRIADGAGAWRWVVLTAEARRDGFGTVTGLAGHLGDVTARQKRALAEWATAAVDATVESRAVIDQAKGALMLTYGLDADAAFGLLVWQSRHTNVKLRELAARLVAAAGGNPDGASAVRARLDEIFYDATFSTGPVAGTLPAGLPLPAGRARRRPRVGPAFEARRTNRGGVRLLQLHGEIDLATAPRLDAVLGEALAAGPADPTGPARPLVIDLRDVRHLGSFGVGLLVAHHRRATRAGVPMRIVTGPGPIRSVLAMLAPDLPLTDEVAPGGPGDPDT
jgi:anti-anti-sigma factor